MAALVRLLAPLGIAAPAVRTAVSRMVRQGWLEPVRLPEGPGYALTPRAVRRLDDAAARIYRTAARRLGRHLAPAGHRPAGRAQPPRPAARRADLPRLRPARRRDLDRAALVGGGRRAARGRGGAGRAVRGPPRRRLAGPGPPGLGPRGAGPRRTPGGCADAERWSSATPAPTPATSRRSPRGPGSCTSGASSCSWTRVCRASCCRQTGPVTRPPTSSTPRAGGCCRGRARFVDPA